MNISDIVKKLKSKSTAIIGGLLVLAVVATVAIIGVVQHINALNNPTVESLTSQIVNEARFYDFIAKDNPSAKKRLEELAAKRSDYAIQAMRESPTEFLESAISSEIVERYFSGIDGIEQKVTVEGKLGVLCAFDEQHEENEGTHDEDTLYYQLTADNGQTYELFFADNIINYIETELVGSMTVRITGYTLGGNLVPDSLHMADDGEGEAVTVLAGPTATSTSGNHKVAVLLVNFDVGQDQTRTADDWRNAMAEVQDWFETVSRDQFTVSGINDPYADVYGYYRVTAGTNGCSPSFWGDQALAIAADTDGFDPDDYDHVLFALASTYHAGVSCPFAGLGDMPGKYTWYDNPVLAMSSTIQTVKHEIGHNLGLNHARAATCYDGDNNIVQVSDNCTYEEYGDYYDVMGRSNFNYPYQAFSQHGLGWIEDDNVQTVTESGTYIINSLDEYSENGVQLLKIPVTYIKPGGSSPTFDTYYLDFRTWKDTSLGKYDMINVRQTSSARIGKPTDLYATLLRPGTHQNAVTVFEDDTMGVKVEVLSMIGDEATLQIDLVDHGLPPCERGETTVTVTPNYENNPNQYGLLLSNTDNAYCGESEYSSVTEYPDIFVNSTTEDLFNPFTMPAGFSANIYTRNTAIKPDAVNGTYYIVHTFTNITSGEVIINRLPIYVTDGIDPCERSLPSVTLTPSENVGKAGGTLTYYLSVKNNDLAACSASNTAIEFVLPTGLTTNNEISTVIQINPGDTYQTTIDVSSSATPAEDSYTLQAKVKNLSYSDSQYATAEAKYFMSTGISSKTTVKDTDLNVSVGDVLSLAATPTTLTMSATPGPNAATSKEQIQVTVYSNAPLGHKAYMSASTNVTNLVHDDNSNYIIPTLLNSTAGQAEALRANTWGYNLGNLSTATFLSIPARSNQDQIIWPAGANGFPQSDQLSVVIGVMVDTATQAGVYKNSLTFTATTEI